VDRHRHLPDIELTALFAVLGNLDLDLIVVPAKTNMLYGYHHVFGGAKARAIGLQTTVVVVGAIGSPLGNLLIDTVGGGAAAFIPCEASLGYTGIAAALEPHGAGAGVSPMLCTPHLPIGRETADPARCSGGS
jgi:hypothetical protein